MSAILSQLNRIKQDIRGARRLTADSRSFYRLGSDFFQSPFLRLLPWMENNRERCINLRGGGRLCYRLNRADMYTIHEVWIEEIYRLPFDIKPSLFVDLGANIGLTSLWIARKYHCSQLIAVEPSPSNADMARKNLQFDGVKTKVMQAAAGAEDGEAVFDAGPGATNGRIVDAQPNPGAPAASRQYAVAVLSMSSILKDLSQDTQIDLLKVDIEGGEQSLLTGNTDWLRRVKTMIIEFHPNLVDYDGLIAILRQSGFTCVSTLCTNLAGGNTLEIFQRQPRPA